MCTSILINPDTYSFTGTVHTQTHPEVYLCFKIYFLQFDTFKNCPNTGDLPSVLNASFWMLHVIHSGLKSSIFMWISLNIICLLILINERATTQFLFGTVSSRKETLCRKVSYNSSNCTDLHHRPKTLKSGCNCMSFSVAVVKLWANKIQNSLQSKSVAHFCTYLTFLIHIIARRISYLLKYCFCLPFHCSLHLRMYCLACEYINTD